MSQWSKLGKNRKNVGISEMDKPKHSPGVAKPRLSGSSSAARGEMLMIHTLLLE
jgi:hypothetical protein